VEHPVDLSSHEAAPPVSTSVASGDGEASVDAALRRRRALVAIGRRAVAPPAISILLQDAAALMSGALETECHAVAELSPDGGSLLQQLTRPASGEDKQHVDTHECGSEGTDSLAGYALREAHPVVVNDLREEQRFADVLLRREGIVSALAVPVQLQDCAFGALAALSRRGLEFVEEDLLFAETIAHLVAATAARKRAEDLLKSERRMAAEVLQTVDALVLTLDTAWQIESLNASGHQMTGFSAEEIRGRAVWSVFAVSEEADAFRSSFEGIDTPDSTVEFNTSLLTKHGEQRQIAWSCRAVCGEGGQIDVIVATGIDVTAQHEATERADRAEQSAEEAQAALEQAREGQPSEDGDAESAAKGADSAKGANPAAKTDRRSRRRKSYPYRQKMAPIMDGNLPELEEFIDIRCNDITTGGCSFLLNSPPTSGNLIVALGLDPDVSYLIAQVAHVSRVWHDGKRCYLIGCNYVGRAEY